MKPVKFIAVLMIVATAVVVYFSNRGKPLAPEMTERPVVSAPAGEEPKAAVAVAGAETPRKRQHEQLPALQQAAAGTNKIDRLNSIRESFRVLAQSGDPLGAMRAAKELKDENERETALLALVTEWTKGELRQPQWRARSIAEVGIDAALGMELAGQPELAKLWANEMTSGPGKTAILQQIAKATVAADAASAFALTEEIPAADRAKFYDEVFQYWGRADTAAALKWANQLPDDERAAAIKSVHEVAPVGIGAALEVRDDYTVIRDLLPGTPAEVSGLLKPGDRLLAIAQGDNSFVDARKLALPDVVQMIRGEPNTVVQLRVLNESAPPGSAPRTVTITRGQITYGGQK